MSVDGFRLRPMQPEDVPFLMSTWLKSNRKSSPLVEFINNDVYYSEHHPVVTKLVNRVGAIVAEVEGADDEIAGYVCAERERKDTIQSDRFVVHYVYVKPLYRKVGLAKCLLEAAGWKQGEDIVATHITYVQTDGRLTKRYRIENNPYLIWR